jgi:hypothetical protein
MTDRLQQLEQQAAAILSEIAVLKAGKAAPPPPPRDEVRIVPVLTETSALPNLKETRLLFEAVRHLAPWPLNDKYDADRPLRGFSCCVRWLANKGRTEQPNAKFALSFWLDQCRGWLRDRNSMTSDVDATTLVLAVYAAADVGYCPSNSMLGHSWELALSEHAAGRPADATAWRRILKEGAAAVRPPSAPARRMAAPSNVRITVGY